MLSHFWEKRRHNRDLRVNLFKGLYQILLEIARIPVPKIGSFIIDDEGFIKLTNRPLAMEIHELEAQHIPVNIPVNMTYSMVDSYIIDMLALHDSRLIHQPNAINDRPDGICQAGTLATMKTTVSHFFQDQYRQGPYVYILIDLHQSNIIVDEDWNIMYLIDLEWTCWRPIEMLHPPHWLTSQAVDMIDVDLYTSVRQEFMGIMEQLEKNLYPNISVSVAAIMNEGWENKNFWYTLALRSTTGIFSIFFDHIQPKFAEEDPDDPTFLRVTYKYWAPETDAFLAKKLKDKETYDVRLREEFDIDPSA